MFPHLSNFSLTVNLIQRKFINDVEDVTSCKPNTCSKKKKKKKKNCRHFISYAFSWKHTAAFRKTEIFTCTYFSCTNHICVVVKTAVCSMEEQDK